MPEISVVVPVYKVENFLDRCVQSVFTQTFTDYELILVDDGSPDRCPELCDDYAKKDDRVRVIHKENGGLSDARNAGIEAANGKYISFVDSDDFIEPEMLSVLYNAVTENDADMGICGMIDCYKTRKVYHDPSDELIVCDGIKAFELTLEGKKAGGSVCNKLIKKEIVGEKRFLKGRLYEDAFFTPELMLACKKVAISLKPLYNYWHQGESITTVTFNSKKTDIIHAYQYTLDVVKERCPELTDLAKFRLCWANFIILDSILPLKNYKKLPEYKQVVKFLKDNKKFIVSCEYFQKSRRIAEYALCFSVGAYKWLSTLNEKRRESF